MSDFEQLDNAWEQAEQSRHAALLRQLKAEVREFRRQTRAAATPSLPVPREQPSQPDPRLVKRGTLLTAVDGLSLAEPHSDRNASTQA